MAGGSPPRPEVGARTLTVTPDRPAGPVGRGTVITEDGRELAVNGALPADLPFGYHEWRPEGAGEHAQRLVVSPGRCPAPPARQWGYATQLYALRSESSWGMGDLADLGELARWSAGIGAGFVLLNPLHAPAPTPHQEPSPYFAASRCFLNPLYLRIADLPGSERLADLARLDAAGRALNGRRLIDRDRIWALKSGALEALFAAFGGDGAFDRFCAERGDALQGFATFAALTERHGVPWQSWPAPLRHPRSAGVAAFARSPAGRQRIRFHAWTQWHLDRQLAAAAVAGAGLVADLAVGVDPGGADAWWWQDSFAPTVRVGAPPDAFNTRGQDWRLAPWDPAKLAASGYEPFVETVRAGFRHGAGLRIDHVMGLSRLYWIPDGQPPGEGAYVRYPFRHLLDILALEAHRAGAFVVGEDLGTVERDVRRRLAERNVLSYRVLWFEDERPAAWPVAALGAVTTHDLPTVAGVWSGADLANQQRLGLAPNVEGAGAMRERLEDWAGVAADATPAEVVGRAYRALGDAPCLLLAAALDDVCCVEERPNVPGTVDQYPNWRLALPLTLEQIEASAVAATVARCLQRDTKAGRPQRET